MNTDRIEILDRNKEVPKPLKTKSSIKNIQFYFEVLCDVLQVIVLYIIHLIKTISTKKVRKDISGKLALVTGGANGLGKKLAFRLAAEKCNIAIVDIDFEGATNTVKELRKQNIKAEAYKADVSDYEAMVKLREQIISDLGMVDILINNAEILPTLSLREGDWTKLERILKVNIHSHFWLVRIFIEDMIKNKYGHILAISSVFAAMNCGTPFLIAYTSSKSAVISFMSCLTEELRVTGLGDFIKTTCVLPYFMNSSQDILDLVKLRFPAYEPEYVADKAIEGLVYEKETVLVIWLAEYSQYLTRMIPKKLNRLIMDIVFQVQPRRLPNLSKKE